MDKTITNTILMVRPANFGFNPETASNNTFQSASAKIDDANVKAQGEFDAFVDKLSDIGVEVIVVEDTPSPIKPDAVFPNNWVSFHADGSIVLYPMYAPVRRLERREDIVAQLIRRFNYNELVQLQGYEMTTPTRFLEGTGSMIFDRENRIAYACISERTNEQLFLEFCTNHNWQPIFFDAFDRNGKAIYHTNVMMSVGVDFAVVCLESIKNTVQRNKLIEQLQQTQKEIIEISFAQMNAFAGNMLQVEGKEANYLVMSTTAYHSLNEEQIDRLQSHTHILTINIPTIETLGGGSVRCMMAEVFVPTGLYA